MDGRTCYTPRDTVSLPGLPGVQTTSPWRPPGGVLSRCPGCIIWLLSTRRNSGSGSYFLIRRKHFIFFWLRTMASMISEKSILEGHLACLLVLPLQDCKGLIFIPTRVKDPSHTRCSLPSSAACHPPRSFLNQWCITGALLAAKRLI